MFLNTCHPVAGGGQHGRSPQQVLCHGAGPETQTGSDPGLSLYGAGAADPVL